MAMSRWFSWSTLFPSVSSEKWLRYKLVFSARKRSHGPSQGFPAEMTFFFEDSRRKKPSNCRLFCWGKEVSCHIFKISAKMPCQIFQKFETAFRILESVGHPDGSDRFEMKGLKIFCLNFEHWRSTWISISFIFCIFSVFSSLLGPQTSAERNWSNCSNESNPFKSFRSVRFARLTWKILRFDELSDSALPEKSGNPQILNYLHLSRNPKFEHFCRRVRPCNAANLVLCVQLFQGW